MEENKQKNDIAAASVMPQAQQQQNVLAPPQSQSGFHELMKLVITDTNLQPVEKKKLLNELRKSSGADRWTYRSAIWILGTVGLLTVGAIWYLSISNGFKAENIPQGLVAIGSSAVGGLAGLLTRLSQFAPKKVYFWARVARKPVIFKG
ncbi:MAG: hypothetical protein DCC43_16015 [Candidatus Brocadia sp.]|nr:hypothetical protein [Candidatus Brocadia fulgida]MCC6325678.1 hypothetical protein [Candidatus Brocadia sp.]MCE7912199.1 hypothetical protein [Candidatus Brocadia sp. AMX3]MDG5997782.1 hypothetical protein [Candidatus Brocadia sp.]RIJ88557.1 MAG: hypothetical protein DCC43_16015 [Candidatus Brocadia sp.]